MPTDLEPHEQERLHLGTSFALTDLLMFVHAAGLLLATALALIVLRQQIALSSAPSKNAAPPWAALQTQSGLPQSSMSALIASSRAAVAAAAAANGSTGGQPVNGDGLRQFEHACRQHFAGRWQADSPAAVSGDGAAAGSAGNRHAGQNDSTAVQLAAPPPSPAADPATLSGGGQVCHPYEEFLVSGASGPSGSESVITSAAAANATVFML